MGLTLDGDGLARALDVPPVTDRPRKLPAGARRAIYVALAATATGPGAPPPPTRFQHRLPVAAGRGVGALGDDGDGVAVNPRAPVVLGPPLESARGWR